MIFYKFHIEMVFMTWKDFFLIVFSDSSKLSLLMFLYKVLGIRSEILVFLLADLCGGQNSSVSVPTLMTLLELVSK